MFVPQFVKGYKYTDLILVEDPSVENKLFSETYGRSKEETAADANINESKCIFFRTDFPLKVDSR